MMDYYQSECEKINGVAIIS